MKELIVSIAMVAFARAKAKSIFSKLRFTTTTKREMKTNATEKYEAQSIKKERSSNYFFLLLVLPL